MKSVKTTQRPAEFDKDGYMPIDDDHNEAIMVMRHSKERVSLYLSLRGASASVFLTHGQARAIASRLIALSGGISPDSD